MRAITSEAVQAFFSGENYKKSNTEVKVVTETYSSAVLKVEMFLHGNCIAKRTMSGVYINDCGWETTTTKERLNGILDHYRNGRIYQKDFVWYWGKGKIFPNSQWNEV